MTTPGRRTCALCEDKSVPHSNPALCDLCYHGRHEACSGVCACKAYLSCGKKTPDLVSETDEPLLARIINYAVKHDAASDNMGFGDLEQALIICWRYLPEDAKQKVFDRCFELWGDEKEWDNG